MHPGERIPFKWTHVYCTETIVFNSTPSNKDILEGPIEPFYSISRHYIPFSKQNFIFLSHILLQFYFNSI